MPSLQHQDNDVITTAKLFFLSNHQREDKEGKGLFSSPNKKWKLLAKVIVAAVQMNSCACGDVPEKTLPTEEHLPAKTFQRFCFTIFSLFIYFLDKCWESCPSTSPQCVTTVVLELISSQLIAAYKVKEQ